MASTFPTTIQYQDITPSGRFAVPYAPAAQLPAYIEIGKALESIGEKISKQEFAVELSTLKRKVDELGYSLYQSASADENENQKLWEKFQSDINSIKSTRPDVQTALEVYVNNVLPDWYRTFTERSLILRQKSAKDQLEINGQLHLERGDIQSYLDDLKSALDTGLITDVEYESKVKDAPIDMAFAQARIAIGQNNAAQAVNMLGQLTDLSGSQLDTRDRLLKLAQAAAKQQSDQAEIKVIKALYDNRDTPIAARQEIADQLVAELATSGIDASAFRVMVDRIQNWTAGQDTTTDPHTYVTIKQMQQDLALGTVQQSAVLDAILSSVTKLSDSDTKRLIDETFGIPDKEDKFWEKQAYEAIERLIMTTDEITGQLFGNVEQITNTYRAKIRLSEAMESAAKAGRPLKGLDILRKAVEIASQLIPKTRMLSLSAGQVLTPSQYAEFVIEQQPPQVKQPSVNPYADEYPDAFYENGEWRVIRNGKKYRIVP